MMTATSLLAVFIAKARFIWALILEGLMMTAIDLLDFRLVVFILGHG